MARCGDVGDDVGSRLIAARLLGDLMRLCFLMERQYAPYAKWFGTAFARLDCAARLLPLFEGVLRAETWQATLQQLFSRPRLLGVTFSFRRSRLNEAAKPATSSAERTASSRSSQMLSRNDWPTRGAPATGRPRSAPACRPAPTAAPVCPSCGH